MWSCELLRYNRAAVHVQLCTNEEKGGRGRQTPGSLFLSPSERTAKAFFPPKLIVDKQNLSIIFQLSKVRLLWQQAQQGILDVLVPSSTLQFLLASRPSWACPKPPQLALLDMKEQRLYSELPQHVWVPLLRHPGARPARACNPILLVTHRLQALITTAVQYKLITAGSATIHQPATSQPSQHSWRFWDEVISMNLSLVVPPGGWPTSWEIWF